MNLSQALDLGNKAKECGFAVAVKDGKVQFQTVEYKESGESIITPRTDWLAYEEAMEIVEA